MGKPEDHYDINTWLTCDACGKHTFPTRKLARKAAKTHHPNEDLNAYRCVYGGSGWHYGHLRPGLRDKYRRSSWA